MTIYTVEQSSDSMLPAVLITITSNCNAAHEMAQRLAKMGSVNDLPVTEAEGPNTHVYIDPKKGSYGRVTKWEVY